MDPKDGAKSDCRASAGGKDTDQDYARYNAAKLLILGGVQLDLALECLERVVNAREMTGVHGRIADLLTNCHGNEKAMNLLARLLERNDQYGVGGAAGNSTRKIECGALPSTRTNSLPAFVSVTCQDPSFFLPG